MTTILFGNSLYDLYLYFNAENLSTVSINGVSLSPSTSDYDFGIKLIKNSFLKSSGITFVLSLVSGYFTYKRMKNINK